MGIIDGKAYYCFIDEDELTQYEDIVCWQTKTELIKRLYGQIAYVKMIAARSLPASFGSDLVAIILTCAMHLIIYNLKSPFQGKMCIYIIWLNWKRKNILLKIWENIVIFSVIPMSSRVFWYTYCRNHWFELLMSVNRIGDVGDMIDNIQN